MKPLMNKSSDRQSFTSLGPLVGELGVPGDKSITHRALILAALARGRSVLTGVGRGLDVAATARILGSVGPPLPATLQSLSLKLRVVDGPA